MMTDVWISAAALCATTLLGSLLGFAIKELPHKWNDTVLGYCAGVMLAASTLGLIVPAFEEGGSSMWWLVALGVMGGAAFLNVLDLLTTHLHHITGLDPERHASGTSLSRVMLFVMAIALHKLPEGIAAGVGFGSDDHALPGGGVAGGQQADFTFDFAGAHLAVAVFVAVHAVLGGHSLQIVEAESGDENTQLLGSLKDGAALFYLNDPVVDREFDH